VNDWRQFFFRVTETREKPFDAIQNEINTLWMKLKQTFKNCVASCGNAHDPPGAALG
jgi:hypothetical protein